MSFVRGRSPDQLYKLIPAGTDSRTTSKVMILQRRPSEYPEVDNPPKYSQRNQYPAPLDDADLCKVRAAIAAQRGQHLVQGHRLDNAREQWYSPFLGNKLGHIILV